MRAGRAAASGTRRRRPAGPAEAAAGLLAELGDLRGKRIAAAVSGGVDSVVLLHVLRELARIHGFDLRALHVHHGLSPNADAWARFVAGLCRQWRVPLSVRRVKVLRRGAGIESAAREARYAALAALKADGVVLAHHLDDQAETILLNLLRGAGVRGASGMRAVSELDGGAAKKLLLRPFLAVPRQAIVEYARARRLRWIEDESNRDAALRRNFIRLRVAPVLGQHYPRWREALARAAAHFAEADELLRGVAGDAARLAVAQLKGSSPATAKLRLREFLARQGLRAPSARKLADMLRQILASSAQAKVAIGHDGKVLRVYRGEVLVARERLAPNAAPPRVAPVRWRGERRVALRALGGELGFRRVRGAGIDPARLAGREVTIGLRRGGERLQTDLRRPRRTLKNLFQEAGVPSWERARLPLVYCDAALVWAPGLGVDAGYRAPGSAIGLLPEWRPGEAS